jgi:phosphatidylglycerophosphatase GEP4
MGQSLNVPALTTLPRVFARRELAVPHLRVATIKQVDWRKLQAAGIRAVVFDKDNTLTAPFAPTLHALVADSVADCVEQFGIDNVAVLSNSAGTPDDKGLIWKSDIEKSTGLSVIVHREKKPACMDEVLAHFGGDGSKWAIVSTSTKDSKHHGEPGRDAPLAIAMVGDRVLTDVVFGNLHGCFTIHCSKTLSDEGDNHVAAVVRQTENTMLSPWIERAGVLPITHPALDKLMGKHTGDRQ